jgi:hypothetical protein
MKRFLCKIIGHNAVGLENVPWGVRCERCGNYGYWYDGWMDAGPVDLGSDQWSEMSAKEKAGYNAFNDSSRKPPFHW